MPRHDELTVLLRSARQLSKPCRDGAALVAEARDAGATHASINTMRLGLAAVDDHLAALAEAPDALGLS